MGAQQDQSFWAIWQKPSRYAGLYPPKVSAAKAVTELDAKDYPLPDDAMPPEGQPRGKVSYTLRHAKHNGKILVYIHGTAPSRFSYISYNFSVMWIASWFLRPEHIPLEKCSAGEPVIHWRINVDREMPLHALVHVKDLYPHAVIIMYGCPPALAC